MSNRTLPDPKRLRVLDAALRVFAKYGYRRASMADIGAEAGMSRPALYLLFRSKQDVLCSLAQRLRDTAIEGATEAWREGASFADNLEATILGKERNIFPMLHASPHGAEILTADTHLTAEVVADLDQAFRALIAARARAAAEAGDISLDCLDGDADAFAAVISSGVKTLVNEAADEAALKLGVRRLVRLAVSGVRPI